MHLVKLRSKNRITLPGKVVVPAGPKEGDRLNFAADGTRSVITAQEVRERGAGGTMTDLVVSGAGRATGRRADPMVLVGPAAHRTGSRDRTGAAGGIAFPGKRS